MKKVFFYLCLFSCIAVKAQTIRVKAKVYTETGYAGMCDMRFSHTDAHNIIMAETAPFAYVVDFGSDNKGCLSTQYVDAGVRWWFTSEYRIGNRIRNYDIAIIDPTQDGANIFFKKTGPDKETMSDSKYMYVISKDDSEEIFKNFIVKATDNLRIVKQGDMFGDGVHLNPNINNE